MSEPDPLSAVGTVGFVTVSYGSESELQPLIASARAATARALAIVVADNHPDGTARAVSEAAGARYLPLPENPGYGTAINRAVAGLPPGLDWIVVSNPDMRWHEGAIDVLIDAAASDPAIAIAGPAILNEDGSVYPSARAIPSLRTGVGHALFANIWLHNPWTRAYRRDEDDSPEERDAGWLSGAGFLIRRDAFLALHGFDEGYFMYFEDVDLGYRAGLAGWRNRYVPTAAAVHGGGHSTSTESTAMIAAHHASASRFLRRKYRAWWLAPVRWSLDLGLRVRSGILRRRAERAIPAR